MNWYRIDYSKLIRLLLPVRLRKLATIAFIRALTLPVSSLHASFMAYRNDANYKINHNSQVCYLQAVLNDNFDFVQRRIYITDSEILDWTRFLWKESEDKPIMLYEDSYFMLNSENFIGADSIDFVVFVPSDLGLVLDDYNRMNAFLRYYKLAGKRYIIQEYV